MQSIDKRVVLAILVLIFIITWLCSVHFPAYSTEDITEECYAIRDRYFELQKRGATNSEWQEFERTSLENLDSIVADFEKTLNPSGDRRALYQLMRYGIPKAIRSKGKGREMNKVFYTLHKELKRLEKFKQDAIAEQQRRAMTEQSTEQSTDPLVVCMLAFDGLLAAGVVYLLWPKRTPRSVRAVLDHETLSRRLDLMDKKIAKNPESAVYHGVRVRLRAELGLREEAIDDIDWLMERKPRGVDLLALYELRNSLIDEMETKDENVNGK